MPKRKPAALADEEAGPSRSTAPKLSTGPIRLDDPAAFPANTRVRVLSGKHADKCGTTLGFDNTDGFYEVGLDDGGSGLLFLPRASLLPRYDVVLMELEARADLNKYRGTVEGWDAEKGRYEVCLQADNSTLKLLPKNALLPDGARVCVSGLQAAQHNGTLGKVRNFDCAAGRYEVEYVKPDGQLGVFKLKRENTLLVAPAVP